MRKLNVTIPASMVPVLQDAILWAVDLARSARDADGNPPGSPYATRRDALGLLHATIVHEANKAPPARTGKRWTRDEDATLRASWGPLRRTADDTGEALQHLADAVQRTPVAVALRLQSLGIWH